jgi:hypothetical protein
VANGRFHVWWPLECSQLGDQWNVPNLMANGKFHAWWPMEGEGKHFFTSSHFPPDNLYLNLQIFSFDFIVLLYHGSKSLLTPFVSFSSIYKLQLRTSM